MAPHAPRGDPILREKILKIFIHYKQHNGERIFKKFEILIFAKKGRGLPRPSGWPNIADKILKIFIHHKELDGEGILKKFETLILTKKRAWPPTPLRVTAKKFFIFLIYYNFLMRNNV